MTGADVIFLVVTVPVVVAVIALDRWAAKRSRRR